MKRVSILLAGLFVLNAGVIRAQQFNSDSWLSKPLGTVTVIPTLGQRNSMLMTTFSLFPRWEFTAAAYLYNDDKDPSTNDGYSSTLYGKFMFYENKAATGGASVKAGTGMFPGYFDGDSRNKDAFRTFWVNFPCTLPLANNKISWDIMPGTCLTRNFGPTQTAAWSFTYSTRVAWYAFSPELAIVGELFGAAGREPSKPDYKMGLRWEPSQFAAFAATYGAEVNGSNGAGFEIGVMLFSPPFVGLGKKSK